VLCYKSAIFVDNSHCAFCNQDEIYRAAWKVLFSKKDNAGIFIALGTFAPCPGSRTCLSNV
jgi:hypothetical protein